MKMQEYSNTVESHGALAESKFGISQDDTAHILVILRDKLYSDKIMAVLREYGTNALDAHIDADCATRPIKVQLPSRFTPFLTIRDYGLGLSEEEIYRTYTQYGKSTKRNSNNAIGQLGLGCKSGFAYTQQFTITSYNGGRKAVYNAYIDESNVGKMTKLLDESYDGIDTGIEVKIPVKLQDVDTFRQRAQSVYYYFEPRPDINTTIKVPAYATTSNWWRVRAEWAQPTAVMGSIGYPLKKERLTDLPADLLMLLDTPIEIRFGIGELSISANREDLEYTDHTKDNIKIRLAQIAKKLKKDIADQFTNASTAWQARLIYWKLVSVRHQAQTYGTRSRNILKEFATRHAVWKGIKLQNTVVPLPVNKNIECKILSPQARGFSQRHYSQFGISQYTMFAINDRPTAYLQRAKSLRSTGNHHNTSVVVFNNCNKIPQDQFEKELNTWLASAGLDGAPLPLLSSIEYVPAARTGGASPGTKAKTSKKVFTLKNNFDPNHHPKSFNWNIAEADLENDEEVYIPIHRFERLVTNADGSTEIISLSSIKIQIELLKEAGFTGTIPTIHGVKPSHVPKLGTKWQSWDTWYETTVEKHLDLNALVQNIVDYAYWCTSPHKDVPMTSHKANWHARVLATASSLGADHPISVYVKQITVKAKQYHRKAERFKKLNSLVHSMKLDTSKTKPSYNFNDEWKAMVNKYYMLPYCDLITRWEISRHKLDAVLRHIKDVDKQEKNNDN